MKVQSFILKFLFAMMLASGCKQNYNPPAVKADLSLLVVDGFLNNSADTTFIRLTRTKKLQEGIGNSEETNASLSVEDPDGNTVYAFQELNTGNYFVPGMNLDITKKYRLRINTINGSQYLSDYIDVKKTPAIDSVSFEKQDNGVMIYANTHDPLNNTLYYRWDYTETFHFRSFYFSILRYENGSMLNRQPDEYVYDCWRSRNSTDVLLGTSAKLSQDIIYRSPIRFIPNDAIELEIKYSILLRQYALTKESFEYYQNLKKITETLGSIFDAQPSQLTGNIHSVNNNDEVVLGYINASSMATSRIFIEKSQVLPWNYGFLCDDARKIPLDSVDYYFKKGSEQTPIEPVYAAFGGMIIGYIGAQTGCVDCVSRGGTNKKPDFWP